MTSRPSGVSARTARRIDPVHSTLTSRLSATRSGLDDPACDVFESTEASSNPRVACARALEPAPCLSEGRGEAFEAAASAGG